MNLNCLFSRHKWMKVGGPRNAGGGRHTQTLKCTVCGELREYTS